MYRLGIDVGETNTDGVLLDQNLQIIKVTKQPTTRDIVSGMASVLREILQQTNIHPDNISAVMIGTMHCLQALLKGKNLSKVGVIRIGIKKGAIPPLFEGNELFRDYICPKYLEIEGGHEVNGRASREIDRSRIKKFLHALNQEGVEAIAVTATFSSMNSEHEKIVADYIHEMLGKEFPITLSHELGSIGFVERENASIINATLSKVMHQALKGLRDLFCNQGINSKIYFTQNDGSLMSYEYALRYPIRTLWSGVTNSLLGASFLTGLKDCIVIDVGGTSTYIGVLESGFPKEKRRNQMIEGVRVNVHMPEIVSLPFGGEHLVDDMFLEKLYQVIQRLQPRYEPLPIVFVGGGAENLAKRFKYPWSEVLLTEYHQYVNAIGACVAPVSGCVDRMFWLDGLTQADALELAKQEAVHLAIQAGAHPQTVMIHNAKMIPLAYVPSKALRVKVKAIGVLSILKGGMQE